MTDRPAPFAFNATRRRLMLECVDLMARMHRIDLDELSARIRALMRRRNASDPSDRS